MPVSTIRYYTHLGLIKAAYRTPGGLRIYKRSAAVKRLMHLKEKRRSCSLEEIGNLQDKENV